MLGTITQLTRNMETFGDKLYNRTNEAIDDVFEQGTIAQLTFQAFNKYIDLNDYPLTYLFLPYHVSSNEILINLSNKS